MRRSESWSVAVAVLSLAVAASAQGALVLRGQGLGDGFGISVCGVGDRDGDGRDDFAIGAPFDEWSPGCFGVVHVFSGADLRELAPLLGSQLGGGYGFALARLGDTDGDGARDLVVGEWDRRIHVYSGSSLQPVRSWSAPQGCVGFGRLVASAGDTNGDGLEDLLVGAASASWGAGLAAIFSVPSPAPLLRRTSSSSISEHVGSAVSAAGDLDHDGFADVLVAAEFGGFHARGLVLAISGRTGGTLFRLSGLDPAERFALSVAGGQDFDRDGTPDLLIGAGPGPQVSGGGRITAFSGVNQRVLWSVTGTPDAPLGSAAAFIGDFDGDGLEDFAALGLHPSAPSHCRVLVCSGANREVLLDELCETPSGAAPVVAGAGDIDGDGRADLLVGVPQVAPSSSRVGHVRVFLGR